MADLNGYNAEDYEPNAGFEPLPKGDYPAFATNSKWVDTRKGDGQYLEFTWEVIDGEFKGRNLWSRLNLKNANEKAVNIANSELSAICRAVGVMRPKDSSDLHNKPVLLGVVCKERKDQPGSFSNDIKKYSAPDAQPSTPAAASTPASSKPAWAK